MSIMKKQGVLIKLKILSWNNIMVKIARIIHQMRKTIEKQEGKKADTTYSKFLH